MKLTSNIRKSNSLRLNLTFLRVNARVIVRGFCLRVRFGLYDLITHPIWVSISKALVARGYRSGTRIKIAMDFHQHNGPDSLRTIWRMLQLRWSLRGPVHKIEISDKLMQIVEMYRLLLIWKKQ
jgi:hypothetical protein